jgi:diadenosine tetraphosphatase ApaH/serine/threonine PP2A family protein phosphatase
MRVAVISDIHANLHALEKTFETIDRLDIDHIFCLGDIVGYGPAPNECIAIVAERCTATVKGNHDSAVIDELSLDHFNSYGETAIRWTRRQLTQRSAEFLRDLPLFHVHDSLTLAHASPLHPEAWRYIFAWPDAQRCFGAFATQFCFIGHTHVPVVVGEDGTVNQFRPEKRYLINVGSVGQARDGNARASFAVLDTERSSVDIVRQEYDIESAAQAILKAGLPDYLAHRLFLGI